MSTITKEQAKDLRNAFQFWQQDYDPVEDKEQYDMFGLGMVAMDALLASLEPVSVFKIDHESSLIKHVKKVVSETNAPPAPEIYHVGDATMRHIFTPTGITDVSDMQPVFDQIETVLAGMWQPAPVSVPTFEEWCESTEQKPVGWVRDAMKEAYNGCRAAMLQGAENAESTTTMQTAPARDSSPKIADSTSGNSPVIPDEVLSAVRKVARIRSDFNDFDGDRRGIGDCLDEAEQELIVTINRHASAIAAAPQQEVKS
ncbi:hypothetical protein [Enterobacter cloacae]|uniref:hypothetical protein n=1 Tax=Enterobacter cloacae TaxID=550 RepID=UPI003CE9705A